VKNVLRFITSILVCQAAGFIGSFFTTPAIPGWYANLQRPTFTPPSWLFAPVWTILFVLMGISLYLVWRKDAKSRAGAMVIFGIQLALNVGWSALFFGLRSPFLGFLEIIALWTAIAVTIVKFSRISRTAAWLLVPYIAWVSFAAVLNFAVWRLNV